MAKSLVIVESPTKAKTIGRYLGKNYQLIATVGHIKDLPKKSLGVEVEDDFSAKYETIRGKGKIIRDIKKAAGEADHVFLAPDPDREGEAIAWHIAEEIKKKSGKVSRIIFHEITKKAIVEALKHPQELNMPKYESQQARRILDRLVGYQISPILWKKVRRGLSAGRVQSVAVKIICEREKEIRQFISEEYWSFQAELEGSKKPVFTAKLAKTEGGKSDVSNKEEADRILDELKNGAYKLAGIDRKERRRYATPPFITSKLQQEAAYKLKYSPKKTMVLAQQLYEGIELGDKGEQGLITYMRTDSTRVSEDALAAVRAFIEGKYGKDYTPEKPNYFKNRKSSQDAHEAIRPTSMELSPEVVKPFLSSDQYKLYRLVWNRFVASQMTPAVYDVTTFEIECGRHLLTSSGSITKFKGYTAVYTEGAEGTDKKEDQLPELEQGEMLKLLNLESRQNFTQPPSRFSEATLVKELEENGVGRPSTYATILSTIQDKEYVARKDGYFTPTELGEVVNQLLDENFKEIMNVEFTADMEEKLDDVEDGKVDWKDLLKNFYGRFQEDLKAAETNMREVKREEIPTGLKCPQCDADLNIKWGKRGSFIACSAYPECSFTSEYRKDEEGIITLVEKEVTNEVCEKCGSKMEIKEGRFGRFLACTNYPECKSTKPIKLSMKCPEPGCDGHVVEKTTRRGKVFYGCGSYPKCKWASWDKPVETPCTECGNTYMVEKRSRDGHVVTKCPACGHAVEKDEEQS